MIKTPIPPNTPMIPHIQMQILYTIVAVGPYDSQSGQIGVHLLLNSSQKKFSLHVTSHLLLLEFEGRISVSMIILFIAVSGTCRSFKRTEAFHL